MVRICFIVTSKHLDFCAFLKNILPQNAVGGCFLVFIFPPWEFCFGLRSNCQEMVNLAVKIEYIAPPAITVGKFWENNATTWSFPHRYFC